MSKIYFIYLDLLRCLRILSTLEIVVSTFRGEIKLWFSGLMMIVFMACTNATSMTPLPVATLTSTPPSPCPLSTQSPRYLLVQPIPPQITASEYALDIRLSKTANTIQGATIITSSASLGPNGGLRIETNTGVFNTNLIQIEPNNTQRITVTVEFEDFALGLFPDASGKCVTVAYERTLQTRSDINGRPLIFAATALTPTPVETEQAKPQAMNTSIPPAIITATSVPKPNASITSTRTACVPNAAFVGDVNTPNPSTMPAQSPFTKIWRVRNTGTCSWESGYLLVPVSGNTFGLNQPAVVPNIPVGATSDLALQMQAPTNAGSYTGFWRLRTPAGKLFGPLLSVNITVAKPVNKPTATPTPPIALGNKTPVPRINATATPKPCDGVPDLGNFEAQRVSPRSNIFTLRWGAVNNADIVELDNGFGPVKTPGERNVLINRDTTFRLMARCGANTIFREVVLTFVR